MSTQLIRMRNAALAVRIETVVGTDVIGGTPIASDYIAADCDVTFDQTAVPNPELTGSLDTSPSIVGGLRPRLRLRIPLRGSGTPGTAPEWGRLMLCSTMAELVTASAVGAPTAATAGTTSSATAAAPFAGTADLYRGMPLLITGDQTVNTVITNYTAGRVATIAHTLAAALTASSLLQVPINVRYSPTSDEAVFKTCTVYLYRDGFRWRFTGCLGTWSVELTTGGMGFLTFDLLGNYVDGPTATALPALALGIVRPTPPRFVGASAMRLDGAIARLRGFTLSGGVGTVLPDNPEATEGYDPAVPISRDVAGSLDPLMETTVSATRFANFRAGTAMRIGAVFGTTAGNRFAICVPLARAVAFSPSARDGLGQDSIGFEADGTDSAAFLAQF